MLEKDRFHSIKRNITRFLISRIEKDPHLRAAGFSRPMASVIVGDFCAGMTPSKLERLSVEFERYEDGAFEQRALGVKNRGKRLFFRACGVVLAETPRLLLSLLCSKARNRIPENCRVVFVAKGTMSNASRRVLSSLEMAGGPDVAFVNTNMGMGFRRPEKRWKGESRFTQVVPISCSSMLPAIWQYLALLWQTGSLLDEMADIVGRRPLPTIVLVDLYRALLMANWAASAKTAKPVPWIFALMRSDTIFMVNVLRGRGAPTLHWLHGTLSRYFTFYAHADICVALNEADAGTVASYGCYRKVVAIPSEKDWPGLAERNEGGAMVLFTNLLHPAQQLEPAELRESLEALFEAAQAVWSGPVRWRPHPRERDAADFSEWVERAAARSIFLEESATLADAVRGAGLAVCTLSGVIQDVVREGRVPALWTRTGYERIGIWAAQPAELSCASVEQLREVVGKLADRQWANAMGERLWNTWNVGAPDIPPMSFFENLGRGFRTEAAGK